MRKRIVSLVIVVCLFLSSIPAFAVEQGTNPYAGKIISIMGDSISTFAGHAESERDRYPDLDDTKNDVADIDETWWMQLVTELGATLGVSESRGSSTVSNNIDADLSSDGRIGKTVAMASWNRINDLDNNGTPDVILFYGGTNDRTRVGDGRYILGTFDSETAPTEVDQDAYKWDTVVDAYSEALLRMKYTYPNAEIISIMTIANGNTSWEAFNAEIKKVCDHYKVPTISLDKVTSIGLLDDKHPNMYGMDIVTNVVKAAMLGEEFKYPMYPYAQVREIPAEAYNDTNLWPATPDGGYYKGLVWNTNVKSVTIPVKEGDKVYASSFQAKAVTGGSSNGIAVAYLKKGKIVQSLGTDTVYDAYLEDGGLIIPAGVDAISVPMWNSIAEADRVVNILTLPDRPVDEPGDEPADEPAEVVPKAFKNLKEIPEGTTCEDNLWTVLGYDEEYWKGTDWNSTYPSITFPVKPGDKISAYSFGAKNQNGSSNKYGIVVTFFDEDGNTVWNPGPTSDSNATSGTYYEYVKNGGYLIVPEGAVAVNVPMWAVNANAYVKLLTLPEPKNDHLWEFSAEGIYNTTNLWELAEAAGKVEGGYYNSSGWQSPKDHHSITIPVKPGDKIFASSFQAKYINGHATNNGIVLTYLYGNTQTRNLGYGDVYGEFEKNGYLTVPDDINVNAVNIVTWNTETNKSRDISNALYHKPVVLLLNLPDDPSVNPNGSPAKTPVQQLPAEAYNDTNLWQYYKDAGKLISGGYYSGITGTWTTGSYSCVTVAVKPGDKITTAALAGDGLVISFWCGDHYVIGYNKKGANAAHDAHGYLTVPGGVNAVNIILSNSQASPYFKITSLPDRPALGDVGGDGEVSVADYTALARYLAGWKDYENIDVSLAAADINKDGSVGMADAMILARYVAGWPGYEEYFE